MTNVKADGHRRRNKAFRSRSSIGIRMLSIDAGALYVAVSI